MIISERIFKILKDKNMTLTESVLEEEGMHVFEWWGGEYHPLEELIAEMDEVKKKQKTGVTD